MHCNNMVSSNTGSDERLGMSSLQFDVPVPVVLLVLLRLVVLPIVLVPPALPTVLVLVVLPVVLVVLRIRVLQYYNTTCTTSTTSATWSPGRAGSWSRSPAQD